MVLTETEVNRIRRVLPRWATPVACVLLALDLLVFLFVHSPLPQWSQILLGVASLVAVGVIILDGFAWAAPFPQRHSR